MTRKRTFSTLALFLASAAACAQRADSFFVRYEARVEDSQREQPHWATPLVTTNPRLEQGLRNDFVRQSLPGSQTTWSYGNTQGLQFIPMRRIELRLSPPPFITHTNPHGPSAEDGFGDAAFRMKYRFYGSPEERHNAIVTFLLAASIPTGKSKNGSCCAILTPTLELGKGLGRFDIVSSAGGTAPVTNAKGLGHQVIWNNALQLKTTRFLWVETEINSAWYFGGKSDGHAQTFATPGVILSRLPLRRHSTGGRETLVLTLGAGEQIALTRAATYNHSPLFTSRLRF